jgi:hypothetical protein
LSYKNTFQGQTNRSSLLGVHFFYQNSLRKEIKPTRNYVYPYHILAPIGMTYFRHHACPLRSVRDAFTRYQYCGVDQLFHGQSEAYNASGSWLSCWSRISHQVGRTHHYKGTPRIHYFMIDPNFSFLFLKINMNGCNSAPLK